MKKSPKTLTNQIWSLVALLLAVGLERSSALGEISIPLLNTVSGEYRNVKIFSRTDTHLSFSHERGTAVIKVAELEKESLTALDQSQAAVQTEAAESSGAVVMLKATPTPKPEPAWLTQTKGAIGKLQSEAAPVQMTRQQLWIALGGLVLAWWFFCLCVSLICRKAGRPGGALAWLPILQMIPMFRAAGMSGWWFVAMFVPVLNLVGQVIWCVKITQARGKGFFTAVMLILPVTNLLAFLYLAFSNGRDAEADAYVPIRPPHALAVN